MMGSFMGGIKKGGVGGSLVKGGHREVGNF